MGGYRWNKKDTVDGCKSISTKFLKDHGYFRGIYMPGGMKWTNSFGEQTGSIGFIVEIDGWHGKVRFQYTSTSRSSDEKSELDYSVGLQATACYFGGKRWWFTCPLIRGNYTCRRRVFKLYLSGGKYFGCRHCYDLTYQSCQDSHRFDRLAWSMGYPDPKSLAKAIKGEW